MEQHDDFPKDQARRWAIAKIVQMSLYFKLSTVGLDVLLPKADSVLSLQPEKRKFDLSEYRFALQQGWTQPFQGMLGEAEEAIFDRIFRLYENAPYLNDKQKVQAWRTLCGFHILLASHVYGAQNNTQAVTKQTNLAMILAKENTYPDLHAVALLQRGVFFMDQGMFSDAVRDFQIAHEIKHIPQQLRGKILAEWARAQARLAQTQEDISAALKHLDEAESMVAKSTLEDFGFLVAFGEDKYKLERGEALIGAPLKSLRAPQAALRYLPDVCRIDAIPSKEVFRTIGHRQAHNHILHSEISIDQGQYPVAVALAEEALAYAVGVQSRVHLNKLVRVCNLLKESPYGNTIEVTMLEIGIMRNLRPELFA